MKDQGQDQLKVPESKNKKSNKKKVNVQTRLKT